MELPPKHRCDATFPRLLQHGITALALKTEPGAAGALVTLVERIELGTESPARLLRRCCCMESPLPSKPPVHRPPGARSVAAVKRSWTGSARARAPRLRSPLAPARAVPRPPPARAVPRRRALAPATVVDHVVPHAATRPVLGRGEWAAPASPAMTPRPRARAAGADLTQPPGGRSFVYEIGRQGPGGPRAVCAREIREGGIRALSGGIPEFLLVTARRLVAFL